MKYSDLPKEVKNHFAAAMFRIEREVGFPALTDKGEELEALLEQVVAFAYQEGRDSGYAEGLSAGRSVGYSEGYSYAVTRDRDE
jgi:hypothetical protein